MGDARGEATQCGQALILDNLVQEQLTLGDVAAHGHRADGIAGAVLELRQGYRDDKKAVWQQRQ